MSFFPLQAIACTALHWDLGDMSCAPARATSLMYDLETNIFASVYCFPSHFQSIPDQDSFAVPYIMGPLGATAM